MRQFRVSIDQLKPGPDLGDKFAAVTANQDLEELTKSIPLSHELSVDNVAPDPTTTLGGGPNRSSPTEATWALEGTRQPDFANLSLARLRLLSGIAIV